MGITYVTVQGAHGSVSLPYDVDANAAMAQLVANAIAGGLGTSIIGADNQHTMNPPALPTGKTGEFVQITSSVGVITLPKGYDYLVDAAPTASFTDANIDPGQEILVGGGNLTLNVPYGSGSIIGGGGSNQISIPSTNSAAWFIGLGNGNDTVKALGAGADTISLGAGHNAVTTGGAATVLGSTVGGSDTITSLGSDVVYGYNSNLNFVGSGASTVIAMGGSDTITGGTGPDLFEAGSAGGSILRAGTGPATLFGGGNGDQLYGNGTGSLNPQQLFAGPGNETLTGSPLANANDAYIASSGNTTINANPNANTNVFAFFDGSAGGAETVNGLSSTNQFDLHLSGYGADDITDVSQAVSGGNLNVTLTDGTKIQFTNVTTLLQPSNFV